MAEPSPKPNAANTETQYYPLTKTAICSIIKLYIFADKCEKNKGGGFMKLWKKLTAAVLIGAAAVSAGLTGGILGSAAAQQSTQKTPIVYDFVPDGESSSGSAVNIRAVQPGETVKVNLTVKNDPGTAGAKMIFGFDGLKLGRVARGQAYTGNFQWNGSDLRCGSDSRRLLYLGSHALPSGDRAGCFLQP